MVAISLVAAVCLGTGTRLPLHGLPVFFCDQRQCAIGSREIPADGGRYLWDGTDFTSNGVYLAVAGTKGGDALAKGLCMTVPKKPEGYAIKVTPRCAAIVGADGVGALYGAVAFAQMARNGFVPCADVQDWPHVRLRGGIGMRNVIGIDGLMEPTNPKAAELYKAGIDALMRAKINLASEFYSVYANPSSEGFYDRVSEIVRYAEERGIRLLIYGTTAVYGKWDKPKGLSFGDWPCIKDANSWAESYFCWSDERLIEESARRFAEHVAKMGSTKPLIVIHPIDRGGVRDPEWWSRRCERCRTKYADGERWRASANLFNIMNRVIRERLPGAEVSSCIYPYSLRLLDANADDPQRGLIDRNFIEYWARMDDAIEDMRFGFVSWTYDADMKQRVRELVKSGRPIHLSDNYSLYAGLVSTSARFAASVVDGDASYQCFSYGPAPDWEDWLLVAAYLWNAKTPGAEVYHGYNYYDPISDHKGPKVVVDEVLRPACERFWGRELATDIMDFLLSGVLPKYIERPSETVEYWNHIRKDVNYDPNGGTVAMTVGNAKPLSDDTMRMRDQVSCAKCAVEAIDRAFQKIGHVEGPARSALYARAYCAPEWLRYAKAQCSFRSGKTQFFKERFDEARRSFEQGLSEFRKDGEQVAQRRAELRLKCPECEWISPRWRPEATDLERQFEEQLTAIRQASGPSEAMTEEWARSYRPSREFAPTALKLAEATDVWEGEKIVDSRIELINRNLYIKPGAKIVFREHGAIDAFGGWLRAEGADFVACSTMTNALRINFEKLQRVEITGCGFRGLRSVGKGQCRSPDQSPGFCRIFATKNGALIENCAFDRCSELVIQQFPRAVLRHNLFVNCERGLRLRWGRDDVVTENVFRDTECEALVCDAESTLVAWNAFVGGGVGIAAREMTADNTPYGGCRLLGNSFWNCKQAFAIRKASGAVFAGNREKGCEKPSLFGMDEKPKNGR